MKLKGIGKIEQHIEKIILAVFALVFIGVFVLQFDVLGDPNAVDIGGRKVSPENAANNIADDARRVLAELESGVVPESFPQSMPQVSEFIRDQLAGGKLIPPTSVALGPRMSVTGDVVANNQDTPVRGTGNDFIVPEVPAPSDIVASVFEGTLHPLVVAEYPEAASFVGSEQPYDFAAVTVQASFDAAGFKAMLRDASGGATPMPDDWTRAIDIVEVMLIRERRDSSGEWVERTEIAPMPGRFSTRQTLRAETFVPASLPEMYKSVAENMGSIRRPAPYRMIHGAKWIWPALASEVRDALGGGGEVGRLLDRKARLQREMDDDAATLETLNERIKDANERQKANIQRQIDQIETRMTANEERMDTLNEQLTARGVDPESGRLVDDPRNKVFEEPVTQLMARETETITLWAHDYSAERGETYRYAMRIWVMNPMFGHRDSLSEAQRPLADSPMIESLDSAWTPDVEVPRETYLFVADAAPPRVGAVAGPARATIEMYQFYYGYWRKAEVVVSPGDAISATLKIPGLVTFEIVPPAEEEQNAVPTLGESAPIDESLNFASGDFLIDVADAPVGVFVSRDGMVVRLPVADASNPVRERVSASAEDGELAGPPSGANGN